jgi:pimeloyl-ACP methyl ester carboxylesterase
MRKVIFCILFTFIMVLLVSPLTAQEGEPRFEAADCMFTLPPGQEPECGYLIVPEDRTQPDSPTIGLAVAIFRSPNPQKAVEPLVYLEGGPGGSALELLNLTFSRFRPFLDDQDVIVFDQRGVGLSQPALDCQEYEDFYYQSLQEVLPVTDYVQQQNMAFAACGARLAADGINLGAYNSRENAADVNDLRAALGYETVNLYGISYGTRLALTILRDHPQTVRSAIIDSVFPPQTTITEAPLNFQRSLDVLFKDCKAGVDCDTAYPDLETTFFGLIERLNAKPISLEITDPNTLRPLTVKMDGDTFASTIFISLYSTELIPSIPKVIYQVQAGDNQFFNLLLPALLLQLKQISYGMNIAVQCNEELAFDSVETMQQILDQLRPELQGFARRNGSDPAQLQVCAAFGAGQPQAVENEAVTSDRPTLVVSGQYDPITPPAGGKLAADSLSNSYFFTFAGAGHGVIASNDCAQSMALAFLKNPATKPDAACLTQVTAPVFITSTTTRAALELEAFTNADSSYSSVKPKGWDEVMAGTYADVSAGLDQSGISFQVLPGGGIDLMLPIVAAQFGASTDSVISYEANGLTWKIVSGEVMGQFATLALAEGDGRVYLIVVIATTESSSEALYEQLLLPAIDAFEVGG